MKEQIVKSAEFLFMQYGVRSVSMDDVARQCSVSKKTLYQHFTNKDALVNEVAKVHMEREKSLMIEAAGEAENAIEELYLISKCLRETVFKMNPSLLYDLQKYHRDAWDTYLDFKHGFIKGNIISNLERGMSEGYFRSDIEPEILAIIRMESIQLVFNEEVFPKSDFNVVEVQIQLFNHFVHGLLTDKGRELYEKYQQNETINQTN